MIEIPTEFSETTKEIMSELEAFTLDEKSSVINLVFAAKFAYQQLCSLFKKDA